LTEHLLAWPGAYASAPLPNKICDEFATPFSILTSIVDKLYKAINTRSKRCPMASVILFLNDTPYRSHPVDSMIFDAIACLATHMIGAASWDCYHINDGMSSDFPTDTCSVDEEKGCIGCRPGASPQTNYYVVCRSLKSYIHLVGHLLLLEDLDQTNVDTSAMGVDEDQIHCIDELLNVLGLFVLADNCLHCFLARCLSNPYWNHYHFQKVDDDCHGNQACH
jgi:hypothetical protein